MGQHCRQLSEPAPALMPCQQVCGSESASWASNPRAFVGRQPAPPHCCALHQAQLTTTPVQGRWCMPVACWEQDLSEFDKSLPKVWDLYHMRILGCDVVQEADSSVAGGHALRLKVVLDQQRHTEQRRQRAVACQHLQRHSWA